MPTVEMRILHVVGARPNFMKVAPVMRALDSRHVTNILVHTGQHYDRALSQTFFDELGLPAPDVHLEVGSASHAAQTARIMERFEPVLVEQRPDLTVVVGDVNSTIAASLVCAKLLIPIAHIEAGLRSFDRTMPEEINRIVTDQLSTLLFTTSPEAEDNLVREGIARAKIHFVGNPMIDSLTNHLEQAGASSILERMGLPDRGYALVTLHRPSNVDDAGTLGRIMKALAELAGDLPVLFPAHPRTVKMMRAHGLDPLVGETGLVQCVEPVGYIDFLRLMDRARVVLTDSGGIQEETMILGTPCLTLRENTERPITIEMGMNKLIGSDPGVLVREARAILAAPRPKPQQPPLWDGHAGERIADAIMSWAGD
jgi:UDP-N-acetylglucosamine 2-epimerase (non-hydrolysing)